MGNRAERIKAVKDRKKEVGSAVKSGVGRGACTPTAETIAMKLRVLANAMDEVAAEIDYYGGFAEWAKHGREMAGAGNIVRQWANEISKQVKANDN